MFIIGVVGEKQSGKDTLCKILHERMPYHRVVRLAFADPLKAELAAACGVSVDEINEQKKRFRLGLQWWGTEFRREEDRNYWINRLLDDLIRVRDSVDARSEKLIVVITDVRFENEAELIRNFNGMLVRLVRGSWMRRLLRKLTRPLRFNHASEELATRSNRYFDYVIHNPGDDLASFAGRINEFILASELVRRANAPTYLEYYRFCQSSRTDS